MRSTIHRLIMLFLLVTLSDSSARPTLPDYRYFRSLSIDLLGRPPSRTELAEFESPGFKLDAWLARALAGPSYATRLRQIYVELLRLEVGPSFPFVPPSVNLRRVPVLGPDGVPIYIYFRRGQRRVLDAIDGEFCLTAAETGQEFVPNQLPSGTAKPIARAVLEERTRVVKPWWLYADYRDTLPKDLIGPSWDRRFPDFKPIEELRFEPDGKTPAHTVRVCREEAQTQATGTVYASGRAKPPSGAPLPPGRHSPLPLDSGFARLSKGRAVSCLTASGFRSSVDCGCGVGLERCMPATGPQPQSPAFTLPLSTPLGTDKPFDFRKQPASTWTRLWWAEEASRFFEYVFAGDRDARELLTSHSTVVNGPLAQFYRFTSASTCCGAAVNVGYTEPESLFEPAAVPASLIPQDTATWLPVADRGPHAAGILTMPIFLAKYGSRRARAHALYSAFACKEFVAPDVKLQPSTEPDLTKRAGCAACHRTLEPMAAYFTRVQEADWTYLPASRLPTSLATCGHPKTKNQGQCVSYYDPAFTDQQRPLLRGAYAAPTNAEAGPAGLARELVSSPEFAPCMVKNVVEGLLRRQLTPADDRWTKDLTKLFVDGGYRLRAVVKAIVTSPRYRDANDTASHLLR